MISVAEAVAEAVALGRQTYVSWRADRTLRLGAGLAYYALFTIIPLLALITAVAGGLFGTADVVGYLTDRIAELGVADAEQVAALINDEISRRSVRTSLGLIGIASLLVASSLLFLALSDAINVIWDVPVESGLRHSIHRRLAAFAMVVVTSGALLASFAVSAVADLVAALIPGDVVVLQRTAHVLEATASSVAVAGALALLYRFVTPTRLRWRLAVLAGVTTAALLGIGTAAIGWFLRSYGVGSVPGAFGAVAATLTWIYVEAQIILVGAQLTKTLARRTRPAADGGPDDVTQAS